MKNKLNSLKKSIKSIDDFFKNSKRELNATEEVLYLFLNMIELKKDEMAIIQRVLGDNPMLFDNEEFLQGYMENIGGFFEKFMDGVSQIESKVDKNKQSDKKALKVLEQEVVEYFMATSTLLYDMLPTDNSEKLSVLIDKLYNSFKILRDSSALDEFGKKTLELLIKQTNIDKITKELIDKQDDEMKIGFVTAITYSCVSMSSLIDLEEIDFLGFDDEFEDDDEECIDDTNTKDIFDTDEFEYSSSTKPKCNICSKEYTDSGIKKHITSCINKNIKGDETLYYLVIKDKYMPNLYLHILVSSRAILAILDSFIREIWVECCGHMSDFRVGRKELKKSENISILSKNKRVDYIYDYGSSTELKIEFVKEFRGKQEKLIRVLSRNPMPKVKCHRCEKEDGIYICSSCYMVENEFILCDKCAKKHIEEYDEGENYLTYLENSPRAGICGYGEEADIE